MVPNDDEVKAYREFDAARKDVSELTEEDKVKVNFMYFRDLIIGTSVILHKVAILRNITHNLF